MTDEVLGEVAALEADESVGEVVLAREECRVLLEQVGVRLRVPRHDPALVAKETAFVGLGHLHALEGDRSGLAGETGRDDLDDVAVVLVDNVCLASAIDAPGSVRVVLRSDLSGSAADSPEGNLGSWRLDDETRFDVAPAGTLLPGCGSGILLELELVALGVDEPFILVEALEAEGSFAEQIPPKPESRGLLPLIVVHQVPLDPQLVVMVADVLEVTHTRHSIHVDERYGAWCASETG